MADKDDSFSKKLENALAIIDRSDHPNSEYYNDQELVTLLKIDQMLIPAIRAKERERLKEEHKKSNGEENLNNFILDESQLPQRLDHAVGVIEINGEKYRYYGAKLNEKLVKKSEGKIVTCIETVNAIVLENGKIISESTKPDNLNFEFDSVMTLKQNRFNLDLINKFCKGLCRKEDYTFDKVFRKFKTFYEEGMVFDLSEWYSFNALWDIATYFWDLIDKFLIPKHEGISGSAKSKGMKISSNLSFNGKKFLCPTPANFFRYRHHNKAAICIEEAEKLFDDSKNKSVGDSELVEYLNGSYEKGNTVPRQNDKNINLTDEFDPAGFLRIGSIKALKGALEKRSIPLNMIKASRTDERGNQEVPAQNDPAYTQARGMAYICGLLYYTNFRNALVEVKNNYELVNRQWIVAKPIIAMARCVDPKLEEDIGKFIAKLFSIRDDTLDENSWEIILSETLVKLLSFYEGGIFLSIEFIKSSFMNELSHHSQPDYKISNTKIGMLMVQLGFSDFKANPTGNQRGYRLDFFKLCEILIRQEWLKIENIKKIVSEVSRCKITDDKINKWYTDTFLTPDTSSKKQSDTLTDMTLVWGEVGTGFPVQTEKIGSSDPKSQPIQPNQPNQNGEVGEHGEVGYVKKGSNTLFSEPKIKEIQEAEAARAGCKLKTGDENAN